MTSSCLSSAFRHFLNISACIFHGFMQHEDKEREVEVIFSICSDMLHLIFALKGWLHLYTWEEFIKAEQTKGKHVRWKMYVQFNLIYLPQWFPKKSMNSWSWTHLCQEEGFRQCSARTTKFGTVLPLSLPCLNRGIHSIHLGGCRADFDYSLDIRKKLVRHFSSIAILKVTLSVGRLTWK